MNKEKLIMWIWGCAVVVFCSFYILQMIFNTIKVWKLSDGSTLSIDGVGLGEVIFICAVYYLSKFILKRS